MKTCFLAACCLLLGCSGAEGADEDASTPTTLTGNWQSSMGDDCVMELTISNGYEKRMLCQLPDGGWGVDLETGIYSATPTFITFTPKMASCITSERSYNNYTVNYSLRSGFLNYSGGSSTLVFDKISAETNIPPAEGQAEATPGCFEHGRFVAGELIAVN